MHFRIQTNSFFVFSECLFGVLNFPKNQRKIWQISAPEPKKWSNHKITAQYCVLNRLNSPHNVFVGHLNIDFQNLDAIVAFLGRSIARFSQQRVFHRHITLLYKCQNHQEDFFRFCVLKKVKEIRWISAGFWPDHFFYNF